MSEILRRLATPALTKQQYLTILNEFSRLCRAGLPPADKSDDVFRQLKNALFHDAAEVRAAALRAIRYLLKDENSIKSLLRVNLPIFIVRSIDIVLENRTERIQALRLVRKFLSISPQLFPSAFTRSLIAIAQDGQVEHDTLTRACWALLAELSIMSPISSTKETQNCAFNAIMDAALAGNQPHGMCESLISTLLYMLNWPKYRCLINGELDLQIFVAPFTDSHYTAPVSKDPSKTTQRILNHHHHQNVARIDLDPYSDQRENKFTASKITLISILRSWQGLIYLCQPQSNEHNLVSNSCLKSLMNMLYLPYNDVRRRLIDLIFELLYLPLPDSTLDFENGLKFLEKHQLSKDSWKIHDAFVVDEAKAILPSLRTRCRLNLVSNYMALLLVALFHCNVVDALSEVIITPSSHENSIKATLLLYQLLTLSYQYLPTDSFSQHLTLSKLIAHATSKVDDSRDLANAALINLGRVHPLKKSSSFANTKCSLFLSQILGYCSSSHSIPGHNSVSNNSGNNNSTLHANSSPRTSYNHHHNHNYNHIQNLNLISSANGASNPVTKSCSVSSSTSNSNNLNSLVSIATSTYSNNYNSNNNVTITSRNMNNSSSSSSTSTLVDVKVSPSSRSSSISSRSPSLLSRSPSISAATTLFTMFSFQSTTKSNIKQIIEQDWQSWDWEHINFILTRPNDSMKKLSSQHYKAFLRRLVHFFKPSSNQYSLIDINNDRCKQLCETGCNMVDFLASSNEPKATELLKELLHDISISMHDSSESGNNNLANHHHQHHATNMMIASTSTVASLNNYNSLNNSCNSNTNNNNINKILTNQTGRSSYISSKVVLPQTTHHNHPHNHTHQHHNHHHHEVNILSSSKLITTMSSTYFLFIGRLSSTIKGYQLLERSSIMKLIENLTQTSMLATSPAEVYVRLIISCFDYTKEFNGSRRVLEKFLFNHPEENVRIYATNFLRVLLRSNVPDFSNWAIELLLKQLDSPLRIVHYAAADILDEACDLDENLEGLIALKQITVDNSDQNITTATNNNTSNNNRNQQQQQQQPDSSTMEPEQRVKNVIDILRSTGDSGILLLARYASSPNGLRYLLETPRQRLSQPLDTVLNNALNENPDPKVDSKQTSPVVTPTSDRMIEAKEMFLAASTKTATTRTTNISSNAAAVGSTKIKSPISRNESASILSVESEFDVELARWQRVFNYRYVKLVEDVLNNSLTYHQKGEDGKYGRRIDKINPMNKNSYLPVHLYGQLALSPEGIEIIQARKLLEPIYQILFNPFKDLNYSEVSVIKFKAALWIIGHVGSSESGYQILSNSKKLIKLITDIAKTASVLSLRGTAFYVLGLLGSTEEGAGELREHKWIVLENDMVALPLNLDLILTKPQDEPATVPQAATVAAEGQLKDKTLSASQELAPQAASTTKSDNGHLTGINNEEIERSEQTKMVEQKVVEEQVEEEEEDASLTMLNDFLKETYTISQLEQIRRDILKYVTNLSGALASRPAENSLLNLKRKFGLVFQYDLKLYSEVCNQLAKYNFRLQARRFLQELFLDITITMKE